MTQLAPEDYSDDELLEMLNPAQRAELDRQIGEMFGAEGVDRAEALFAMANVYSLRAAERDETSAMAMLPVRAEAERMMAASGASTSRDQCMTKPPSSPILY